MTLKIAEIGLNHFGRMDYLYDYINFLSQKKIDGITIQIIKKESLSKSNKKFYLDDKKVISFIKIAKKKFKFVGVITDDFDRLMLFNKLNVNFFKLTSGMINNTNLIKKMINYPCTKKIYISTGFSSFKDIKKVLKRVGKNKINLIHTSFDKKITKVNLNKINLLRDEFRIPVAYGNHSQYFSCITNSVFFNPCAIFFYVKLNKNLNYPDKKHAVSLKELDQVLKDIKKNEKLL